MFEPPSGATSARYCDETFPHKKLSLQIQGTEVKDKHYYCCCTKTTNPLRCYDHNRSHSYILHYTEALK